MKREKVMFGVEFSLGEKGLKSARKMSAFLRHMEVPALGFNLRVDVTGEPAYVAIVFPRKRKPATQDLRQMTEKLNDRYFSEGDGELRFVRETGNDGADTFAVKLCGKETDAGHLADGEKSLTVMGGCDTLKELYDGMREIEARGYTKKLMYFDRAHADTGEKEKPEAPVLSEDKTPEGPLEWRPQRKDAPIPREVVDARLALLSKEDSDRVRFAVETKLAAPYFLYFYCGGESERADRMHGGLTEKELMTIHMCAYISKDEAQAMRIFRGSTACKGPTRPYEKAVAAAAKAVDVCRDPVTHEVKKGEPLLVPEGTRVRIVDSGYGKGD